MTNHWNQNRSSFRTGEPIDHKRAKNFITRLLETQGLSVHKEYPLVDSLVPPYKHNYDVVAFTKVIVVEIDDPNLHSKPRKMRNDRIAQAHAEDHFKDIRFIRLNKDEINNVNKDDVANYLNGSFWNKLP